MFEFLSVKADITTNSFENISYLPFILNLFFQNKHLLADDALPSDEKELVEFLLEEINSLYPWFVVGLQDGIPVGIAWVSHWHVGKNNSYHSCQIHGCIDRKFRGKIALSITSAFLDILFSGIGVKRIQAEVPENNFPAAAFLRHLGFQKEGVIRHACQKNGLPSNNLLFGLVKD